MTIAAWVIFGFLAICVAGAVVIICVCNYGPVAPAISIPVGCVVIAGMLFGFLWYYKNTASGQRSLIDQRSDFRNGLERTITVYTANGDKIAEYEGQIDIEANAGGYIKFDFEGKRYIYYNCFVESIAEIP